MNEPIGSGHDQPGDLPPEGRRVTGRGPYWWGRSRLGRFGLALFGALVLIAVAAPWLSPYDPSARSGRPFERPSAEHRLGTNDVGQDLLSELLFGARVSLAVGLGAALAATIVGVAVGLMAGHARGWADTVLMGVVDVVMSLPLLPLVLVVGVFLGPGLGTQVLVIAGVLWARTARELRSQVLAVRELDHVAAARAMGGRAAHVLSRHVLPAVGPLVVAQFVVAVKTAIVLEATLGFLGLGDPTAKSWGTTLYYANARSAFLTDAWLWWVLPAGLGIAVTVLCFAFIGYALEEPGRLAPVRRPRRRHRRPAPAATPAGPVGHDRHRGPARPSPRLAGPAVLEIQDLTIEYGPRPRSVRAVEGVSLSVQRGEVVGLVGESGSGKSTLAAAVLGLTRPPAVMIAGRVVLAGDDLAGLGAEELRRIRGTRVALVPQQAAYCLNPVLRIGDQLAEAITVHHNVGRDDALARAAELLEMVHIDPGRADAYPHQFSGGMRQRVVIAIALANEPALLVADEPTTGLDVLVESEILALLDELRHRLGLALLVVSHDLPVVVSIADRLAVMHNGHLVEEGPAGHVAARPSHPYTRRLLAAVPDLPDPAPAGALVTAR